MLQASSNLCKSVKSAVSNSVFGIKPVVDAVEASDSQLRDEFLESQRKAKRSIRH
jgi:hypothetical protein